MVRKIAYEEAFELMVIKPFRTELFHYTYTDHALTFCGLHCGVTPDYYVGEMRSPVAATCLVCIAEAPRR